MAKVVVEITRIEPQRDQFLIKDKVVQDVEFYNSTFPATDVHAFKRFVMACKIAMAGKDYMFKIIFNARSHVVRVVAPESPVTAKLIGQGVVRTLLRFRDIASPRIIVDREGFFEFAVEDAIWACAILHDLRDHGGFAVEASWSPQNSPFSPW